MRGFDLSKVMSSIATCSCFPCFIVRSLVGSIHYRVKKFHGVRVNVLFGDKVECKRAQHLHSHAVPCFGGDTSATICISSKYVTPPLCNFLLRYVLCGLLSFLAPFFARKFFAL